MMTRRKNRLGHKKARDRFPSVAANALAVKIYKLPHVGHESLLLVWRQ
jgi:hypothetical protein